MIQSEHPAIGDDKNYVSEQLRQFRNTPKSGHRNITSSQMAVRSETLGSKIVRFPEINKGLLECMDKNSKTKHSATLEVISQDQKGYEIYEKIKQEDVSPKEIYHAQTDINQSRQYIKQGRIDYQQTSRLSSLLGKIKKDRKESEEELKIIENRVKMLKKEEEKTQKKTEQIRQKSEDLAQIKQRHAFEIQQRQLIMKEEAEKAALAREIAQKKKEKSKHIDNLGEILLRNQAMYVQTKREQELSKIIISVMTQKDIDENARHVRKMRKKQAAGLKKIKEQKAGVEKIIERYQDAFQAETQLKQEKDQKIQKLEENEQMLIKRLQKSRNLQKQSIMHLQEISQLKPADVIAQVSKSVTPTSYDGDTKTNKMPDKMFNLSQRDVFKDKDDYQSNRKGSQSVKGSRRRVYSDLQSLQVQLSDGNTFDLKMPKRRFVGLKELNVNNPSNNKENQGQILDNIENFYNKNNQSNDQTNLNESSKLDSRSVGEIIIFPDLISNLPEDNNNIEQKDLGQCQSQESQKSDNLQLELSSGINEEKRDLENHHKEDNLDKKDIINISPNDIVLNKLNDQVPAKFKQLSIMEPQIIQEIPKKNKNKRSKSISDNSPNNISNKNNKSTYGILPVEIKDSQEQQIKSKKPVKKPRANSKTSKREQQQQQSSASVYLQPIILPYAGLNSAQIKFLMQVSRRKQSPMMNTKTFQDNSVIKQ